MFFFSYFYFISVVVLEQIVFFSVLFVSLYFLDLDVTIELKLNAEFNFLSNYYLERMEFPTNFWNSVIPVSICSYSIDQQNVVWCNSVIEESSFHLVNVVVRIGLSCRNFKQLVHFGLLIYFRLWVY